MDIYKPTLDEWEKLKKIRLEAIKKEPRAFLNKLEIEADLPMETWHEWIKQSQKNALLFAREVNEIIGMIGLKDVEGKAHIWGLYVLHEYREKGIGKLLFKSILGESRSLGYEKAELTVNASQLKAISLYQSFGFSIKETIAFGNEQKYLMEKQLSI